MVFSVFMRGGVLLGFSTGVGGGLWVCGSGIGWSVVTVVATDVGLWLRWSLVVGVGLWSPLWVTVNL